MKTFIKGFKSGMKLFGSCISAIINTVLLSMVYLLGVGVTSIVAKIAGKHFLEKDIEKKKKSYWEPLDLKTQPKDEYYRQF